MVDTNRYTILPTSDELPCSDDTPVDNEDQNFLPNYLLFLLELIWKERKDLVFRCGHGYLSHDWREPQSACCPRWLP